MFYKQRTKHCVANHPHLHKLHLCLNLLTLPILCSHQLHNPSLVTLRHDLRALAHFQPHLAFHCHKFPYSKHHLPDLSLRIQRLHLPSPFLENVKTRKRSCIHVSSISTVNHRNSERNKTKLLGFYHMCKPAQLVLGVSM